MNPRFSLSILLFISAFALPCWLTLVFLVWAVFSWSWYYESLIIIAAYELVYRSPATVLWLTLGAFVTLFLVEWLKERLYVFR